VVFALNNDYEKLAFLVANAKNKNQPAFRELYEETWRPLYYHIVSRVANREDAQDLLQDVYISAFDNINSLTENIAFMKWLYQIANNRVNNYFSRTKKKVDFIIDEDDMPYALDEIESDFLTEQQLIKSETSEELMSVIKKLPDKQKSSLLLFYYDNFNIAEISDIFECSENVIKKRLFDARATLRRLLEATNIK